MCEHKNEVFASGTSGDERRLLKKLKSLKNRLSPQRVAEVMCQEFKEQFPGWEASYKLHGWGLFKPNLSLDEVAYPKGNSWGELEANLKQVARRFERDEDCLKYWDRMRSLWRILPGDAGQRNRRRVYRQIDKGKSWEEAHPIQRMGMCSLCWRAAPVRAGYYSRLLCHQHELSSRDPEYRRRYRWRFKKDAEGYSKYDRLMEKRRALFYPFRKNIQLKAIVESVGRDPMPISIDRAWVDAPYLVVSRLPHIKRYLDGLQVDLSRSSAIIMALESPHPKGEQEDVVGIRKHFYEDCAWYISFYVEHLIAAEIWLELEETTRRGGARTGAGRKKEA